MHTKYEIVLNELRPSLKLFSLLILKPCIFCHNNEAVTVKNTADVWKFPLEK
jgi:hypothetical protein